MEVNDWKYTLTYLLTLYIDNLYRMNSATNTGKYVLVTYNRKKIKVFVTDFMTMYHNIRMAYSKLPYFPDSFVVKYFDEYFKEYLDLTSDEDLENVQRLFVFDEIDTTNSNADEINTNADETTADEVESSTGIVNKVTDTVGDKDLILNIENVAPNTLTDNNR